MHVSSALWLITGVQRAGVPLPPPLSAAHHLPLMPLYHQILRVLNPASSQEVTKVSQW